MVTQHPSPPDSMTIQQKWQFRNSFRVWRGTFAPLYISAHFWPAVSPNPSHSGHSTSYSLGVRRAVIKRGLVSPACVARQLYHRRVAPCSLDASHAWCPCRLDVCRCTSRRSPRWSVAAVDSASPVAAASGKYRQWTGRRTADQAPMADEQPVRHADTHRYSLYSWQGKLLYRNPVFFIAAVQPYWLSMKSPMNSFAIYINRFVQNLAMQACEFHSVMSNC